MMASVISCKTCGGVNLRRSRRQSKLEWLQMSVGTYPFRCLDCNRRVRVNVFLLSRLAYAKCPKCLGPQLSNSLRGQNHLPFWKSLLLTFGANPYRCGLCRHRFLSFRPLQNAIQPVPAQIAEETAEIPIEEGNA